MFVDSDFPALLGAELYRPHPTYLAEYVCQPVVVHDFGIQPGQTIQLDRYRFWGDPGTKESRKRTANQSIGTANTKDIAKDKVLVTLDEYTGPASPINPNEPGVFKVSTHTLVKAQRLLLDTGSLTQFHNSIGSLTLLDDYRRWRDRVIINELAAAEGKGAASESQGGYYFPKGKIKDSSGIVTYTAQEISNSEHRFDVTEDLLTTVEWMRKRNIPAFEGGRYRALSDPTFMTHLRANSDFREVARYPGNGLVQPDFASYLQPNAAIFMGGQYGQSMFVNGEQTMPLGFQFEGVHWFDSTNFPAKLQNSVFDSTTAQRRVAQCLFFGQMAIGIGVGGANAQVLINNNDDYSRFISVVWQLFAGFELLNADFVTVAYSFIDNV